MTKGAHKGDYVTEVVPAAQAPVPDSQPEQSEATIADAVANPQAQAALAARVDAMRPQLEAFQNKLMERFSDYILGTAILPPLPDRPDKTAMLILIDDTDSKKMAKSELREKLHNIFTQEATNIDPNLEPETLLLSELWGFCFDAKYDVLGNIAQATILFDKGMLGAVKLAETHKQMVLKKFEKYIVCYVLAGSLTQGTATTKSDVDVFIVIDDTDVKKMTRAELKDKLRAIIIDMGYHAGELTGITNKINIQVYILTDFWENIKEANPVIFTFLRDGVPFYDRGVFMPWKQLLEMGKIKPSPEAIDAFMSQGDQWLKRVSLKLKEIGMEDFFWATLTPSQAALMLYGLPPPTPKETPNVMRDIFVKKEKLLTDKDVDTLAKVIQLRKDLEHGDRTSVTGAEIDALTIESEAYLKRLQELFEAINARKEAENVLHAYESTVTAIRDALRLVNVKESPEAKLGELFDKHLVHSGLVAEKYSRYVQDIVNAKKLYDKKKLTKTDIAETTKQARELFKVLIEHVQRSRTRELERVRMRIRHGEKIGEVLFLRQHLLVVRDVQAQEGFMLGAYESSGAVTNLHDVTPEEFEQALIEPQPAELVGVQAETLTALRAVFGAEMEILL